MSMKPAERPERRRVLTSGRVGLVCGALALTVSTGLPSEAAKLIDGNNLKNHSVAGKKLKNGTVTGKQVKNNSLKGADIKEKSLSGVLMSGSVAAYGNASSAYLDDFVSGGFTPIVSKSFSTSGAGYLQLTGSVSAEDDASLGGNGRLLYRIVVDGKPMTGDLFAHELDYSGSGHGDSGAVTAVAKVGKGSHTVSLEAMEWGTGSFITGREISALAVPSGSTNAAPAKVSKQVPQR